MRVLFLNTFEMHGGAGLAAYRLYQALKTHTEIQVDYLSQFKGDFRKSRPVNYAALFRIGREKLKLRQNLTRKNDLFKFETGVTGKNILKDARVSESDIIHLHWINQGFLSLRTLGQLASIKPLVWTMHDMWPFTGGCTYSGECANYKNSCGHCPFLRRRNSNDLSHLIWEKKETIYKSTRITLVGPSQWMAARAGESALGKLADIQSIPNAIDTDFFSPSDPEKARRTLGVDENALILLFGAQNIDDERKGFRYLAESLRIIREGNPAIAGKILLLVFGETKNVNLFRDFPVKVKYLGIIRDQENLKLAYLASSLYVHCATIDNLPNTIVEALSCGTPVIASGSGGTEELITDGFNGFLVQKENAGALADCIIQFSGLINSWPGFRNNARTKAVNSFSMKMIARSWSALYGKILNDRSG
jgi:glycosyltransferase involved in cell wall biosynthesis